MDKKTPHPFLASPHRTLLTLSVPVFFSLVAEPLTGIVDNIFVKQLGAIGLSALGIGTVAISSLFWVFHFLSVGTQTTIAQALGRAEKTTARDVTSLALTLSLAFGIVIWLAFSLFAVPIGRLLSGEGPILDQAVRYIQMRAWGAPAVLLSQTAFGALRGLQDMRTPSLIAVGMNLLNMVLDAAFIVGFWIVPPLGIGGIGLASSLSQWLGTLVVLVILWRKLGLTRRFRIAEAKNLLIVGGDLFIRTGLVVRQKSLDT